MVVIIRALFFVAHANAGSAKRRLRALRDAMGMELHDMRGGVYRCGSERSRDSLRDEQLFAEFVDQFGQHICKSQRFFLTEFNGVAELRAGFDANSATRGYPNTNVSVGNFMNFDVIHSY